MAEKSSKQTPREFLSDFIELYRSFPCLWLVKSKEYSDRNKKDLAYIELVKKYKEFDPLADRNAVVKKINALRTVFKKELLKVKNSEKSGSGTGDIYKPNLWYFDLLMFLNDNDSARPSRSTLSDGDEATNQDEDSESTDLDHFQKECNTSALPTSGDDASNTSQSGSTIASRPKRKKNLSPADEVIQLAGEHLKSIRPDDEFEAYGKYIAHKLRSLKEKQAIFARKLINDVIFEGELDALTKDFKVVNIQPHQSFGNNEYQQFNYQLNPQHPYPPHSTSQMPEQFLHSNIRYPQQNTHNSSRQQQLPNQYNPPEQANFQQPITYQPEFQQTNDSNYKSHSDPNQSTDKNISSFYSNFSV